MFRENQDVPELDLFRLLKGCAAGDRSCQKRLYDRYAPKMMALCLRYSNNQEEAEEILQDGFLQMYKFIAQYKKTGSFDAWLRKIMINCALMRYRGKTQLYQFTPLTDDHNALIAADDLSGKLDERELTRLIQRLPPAYRMVFNLYVFEGFKHREIALLLGIAEGTSKSNLSDAKALLRRSLTGNLKAAK